MGIANGLQSFVDVVDQLEAEGHELSSVVSKAGRDGVGGSLSVEVPLLDPATLDDDVDLAVTAVNVDSGTVELDVSVLVAEDGEAPPPVEVEILDGDDGTSVPLSEPTEEETPAYKKPELLREVYQRYETFPEMTEALGVDVTPKTVRNHMVEHGIHDPEINKPPGQTGGTADEPADASESVDDPGAGVTREEGGSGVDDVDEVEDGVDVVDDDAGDVVADDGGDAVVADPADADSATIREDEVSATPEPGENDDASADEVGDTTSSADADADDPEDGGLEVAGVDEGTETAAAASDSSPPVDDEVVPDGLGLPEHVTLEEVKDSVRSSDTVHEVRRHLDLDREQVKSILDGLNLLELVYGRVSTRARDSTQITEDEIDRRIRMASASGSV